MTAERAEVAVVGGGPAGAAAAIRLARAGADVLLLERSRAAGHKLCGEFVSGEALAALRGLGVDAPGLGAVPLTRVRLAAGEVAAEASLPFPAAGLSRRTLDAALLREAERAGVRVRRGVAVRRVDAEDARISIRLAGGTTVDAANAILATGKHDLDRAARGTRWRGRAGMLGLKMHFRLAPEAAARLGHAVDLHLFPGGCAGFQPVEGGAANLCITLDRTTFAQVEHDFGRLLGGIAQANAAFAAAIGDARPLWPRPLAIARVPYGHLRKAGDVPDNLWPVGDQMAVTASFTGDGVALALSSGTAAAGALLAGDPSAAYVRAYRRRAARQMQPAMALQSLIDYASLHNPLVGVARRQPWLIRAAARATRLPRSAEPALAGDRWRLDGTTPPDRNQETCDVAEERAS